MAIVLYVFLEQTQVGRHMYAIGGNAETARLSGIAVKRYALMALGISAMCAALGGMIVAANLGVGRPQGVGDTYLLDSFAAAFIGASTLRPGRFHILGTVIGVLLIGVINNGLSIMGVETFWQYAVRGIILLARRVRRQLPRDEASMSGDPRSHGSSSLTGGARAGGMGRAICGVLPAPGGHGRPLRRRVRPWRATPTTRWRRRTTCQQAAAELVGARAGAAGGLRRHRRGARSRRSSTARWTSTGGSTCWSTAPGSRSACPR